jgi:hypothetical protein
MSSWLTFNGHYFRQLQVQGETTPRQTYLRELPSSPNYSFETDQSSGRRQFYTPWGITPATTPLQVNGDICGFSTVGTWPLYGEYLSRTVPMDNPDFPGFYYARSCSMEPWGAAGNDFNGVGYTMEAKVDVGFHAPMYAILTDAQLMAAMTNGEAFPDEASLLRYIEFDLQPVAKYQSIPSYGPLRWSARPGSGIDGGPGPGNAVVNYRAVLLYEADLRLTWKQVPIDAYPAAAVQACIGTTNLNALGYPTSIIGQSFAPGTLVCGTPKLKMVRIPNGDFGYDVTYVFRWYPFGANSFFWQGTAGTPGFYPASYANTDGTLGKPLYPSTDFNFLFRLAGSE